VADSGPSTASVIRVTLTVVGVLLLVYAAFLIRQILVLVVVAMFLAIGLDPLVQGLRRVRLSRGLAVMVVFVGAIVFVGGFVASVTPPLVRQTQRLAQEIPDFVDRLSTRNDRFRELDRRYDIRDRLGESVGNLPDLAARSAGSVLGVARSVGRAAFSIVTVAILTVYFLLDLPNLIAGATRLLPLHRRERFMQVSGVVYGRISGYMLGQLTVSVTAGVASFVFLSVASVPYSVPLAMWVALSALIPMVGSMLGSIPAVLVAFFVSPLRGIATLVFFLAYQQVENYLVAPRIMRRAVDISPAAVILAALIGATLLGFVGALLAIPLAASLKVLVQEVWMARHEADAPVSA
jgi:predicted PurR-regulated permease PerM